MRKEIPIRKKSRREINDALYNAFMKEYKSQEKTPSFVAKQNISSTIKEFLDKIESGDKKFDNEIDEFLWYHYKRVAYKAEPPIKGKTYRNNKIVDMSYEVLTHETTTDKILNPGNFEAQKRMGYLVAAYKNPTNSTLTWEYLNSLKTDELKDKCFENKNLSFIDIQTQFYKQNSAAAALIGMFAVHKVAHAVLESNGYQLNVDAICNLKEPFIIADMEFGGDMVIDAKYDTKGQLIGKSLGSLVASAVDAVKDPVLNLMNINGRTASLLNTLVRLGMPFEDASLFLSQDCITKILSEYNTKSVSSFVKLGDVVTERLQFLEKEHKIDNSSPILSEPLTKDELVKGVRKNTPEMEYKVLRDFLRIQKLSIAIKGPTYATRFNSISNAVGPLIIDNLIIENKMKQFSENILGEDGEPIDISDILRRHPILNEFSRTVNLAKRVFGNMPANSNGFRNVLNAFDESTRDIIYNDRKLLSSLSDFYQSYLMVASGAVKSSQLDRYINNFPTWFFKQNFKEKYKNNALVQAIKLDIDKKGRVFIKVDTTGLDTQQKEVLSTSWIDLHKTNPELSIQLFMYNFFKSGVGFNPKTFMSLVPTYVKERIPGYKETYKTLPSTSPELIIDQFIRNNWGNNKLVPRVDIEKYKLHDNALEVSNKVDKAKVESKSYIKVKIKGKDILYKLDSKTEYSIYFKEVQPLGNNNEYLEISTSNIEKAKEIPIIAKEQETDNLVSSKEEDTDIPTQNTTKIEQDETLDLLYKIMEDGVKAINREQAIQRVEKHKSLSDEEKKTIEDKTKTYIKNRLEALNIKYNSDKIEEIYKELC